MDQKVKFLTQIASILAGIENDIERQMYIDLIAKKYNIGSGPILSEVEKRLKKSITESVIFDSQIINKKMQTENMFQLGFVQNIKKIEKIVR